MKLVVVCALSILVGRPSHDGRELKHAAKRVVDGALRRPSHDGRELKLLEGSVHLAGDVGRPSHDGRELKRHGVVHGGDDEPLPVTRRA